MGFKHLALAGLFALGLAQPAFSVVTNLTTQTTTAYGNGSTTNFTISFDFRDNTEVAVVLYDTSTTPTTITPLTYGSGAGKFTISGGNPGTTVVMGTAPTTTQYLIITRTIPYTQPVNYDDAAAFPSSDHEDEMDKIVMMIQDLSAGQLGGNILTSGSITTTSPTGFVGVGSNITGIPVTSITGSFVTSVGAPNATSTADGADITGTVLSLHYADGTNPGIISATGQTIAGVKTFQKSVLAPNISVNAVDFGAKADWGVTSAVTNGIAVQNAMNSFLPTSGFISTTFTTNPMKMTSTAHGLTTGQTVYIENLQNVAPAVSGPLVATVVDANHFTVPINGTAGVTGTSGDWTRNGGTVVINKGTAWGSVALVPDVTILDHSGWDYQNNIWGYIDRIITSTSNPSAKDGGFYVTDSYHPSLVLNNANGGITSNNASVFWFYSGNPFWQLDGSRVLGDHNFTLVGRAAGNFGTPYLTVLDNTGLVGIGTSSPSQQLVVGTDLGAVTTGQAMVVGSSGTGSSIWVGQTNSDNLAMVWNYSATAGNRTASINYGATSQTANTLTFESGEAVFDHALGVVGALGVSGATTLTTLTAGTGSFTGPILTAAMAVSGAITTGNASASLISLAPTTTSRSKAINFQEPSGSTVYSWQISSEQLRDNTLDFIPSAGTGGSSTYSTALMELKQGVGVGVNMVPVNALDVTGTFGVTATASIAGAGAASTPGLLISGAPYTGGSTATNMPQLYVNSGSTAGVFSANGTVLGANAPSGFTGNLMDLQNNGSASVFSISSAGLITENGYGASPTLNLTRINGTAASSSAVTAAQTIGVIGFRGAKDVTPTLGTGAQIIGTSFNGWSSTDTSAALRFLTAPSGSTSLSERMRIFSTGDISIGSTTDVAPLYVNGSGAFNTTAVTGSAFNSSGTVYMAAITTGTTALDFACWNPVTGQLTGDSAGTCLVSTLETKENIVPLADGLAEIMALRPVAFDYKPEYNSSHYGRQVGFIAEEVEKVDSRIAGYDTGTGELRSVAYPQITAPLVKAVQEQQKEIEELREEIKLLKRRRR